MSQKFAAAVLEGFIGTVDELLDHHLPREAGRALTKLRMQIVVGIDTLIGLSRESESSSDDHERYMV